MLEENPAGPSFSKTPVRCNTSTLRTDGKTYTASTTNDYGIGNAYALGAVVSSRSYTTVTGESAKTSRTTGTFEWWDGALQETSAYDADIYSSSNDIYETTYTYNGLGQLTRMAIEDGKPRSATFSLDELGQVIRRDETRPSAAPSSQTGSPHEVWYRFAGREFGYAGNNGGTEELTHAASIADRQYAPPADRGTYRGGRTAPATYTDFAQGPDTINAYGQGSTAGAYTVQGGDTLASIAHKLYGDASLWYKLAEANGLSANTAPIEGQSLVLPAGVTRNTNSAATFKPYDPAQAIGELSPTAPKPPKHNKCGVLGMVLLAVVAVAVATIVTAGAASAISGQAFGAVLGAMTSGAAVSGVGAGAWIAGGAIGGAVGSAVSQGIGVATGIQDTFSWKGVALAGIAGGIGGGLGTVIKGTGLLAGAARGAAGSALTQGIGRVTGLQDSFSWAGVAAAGVGGGIGAWVGSGAGKHTGGSFGGRLAANTAGAIAGAATRSAINGESFGRNLAASLPDVIGQALGNAIAGGIAGAATGRSGPVNLLAGTPFDGPAQQIAADPVAADWLTEGERVELAQRIQQRAGRTILSESDLAEIASWEFANSNDIREMHGDVLSMAAGVTAKQGQFSIFSVGDYEAVVRDLHRFGQDNLESVVMSAAGVIEELGRDTTALRLAIHNYDRLAVHDPNFAAASALAELHLAKVNAEVDAAFNRDVADFGRAYLEVASYINPAADAANVAIDYHNGDATLLDVSLSLLPGRLPNIKKLPDRRVDDIDPRNIPRNAGELADFLTNNANSKTLVLGKSNAGGKYPGPDYQDVALQRGAAYFGTDDDTYKLIVDTVGQDMVAKANKIFLRRQLAKSPEEIVLSHDPSRWRGTTTAFGMEIQALDKAGYRFPSMPDKNGLWRSR